MMTASSAVHKRSTSFEDDKGAFDHSQSHSLLPIDVVVECQILDQNSFELLFLDK